MAGRFDAASVSVRALTPLAHTVARVRMDARIARAAQTERVRANLDLMDIARTANVSEATVSRFEAGRGWRRETNAIVAAYAELCGLAPEDLWRAALNLEGTSREHSPEGTRCFSRVNPP